MDHVTKSFAPPPPPQASTTTAPLSPPTTPRPTSSTENKRSPSSLLMSLLYPLLPSSGFNRSPSPTTLQSFEVQQHFASHQGKLTTPSGHQRTANPQRYHRQHARSVLVDTFTRFVIPFLKHQLPVFFLGRSATTSSGNTGTSGYLVLAVAVDVQKKQREWCRMKSEIEELLLPLPVPILESVSSQSLRRPSLGRKDASDHLQKIDWKALDTDEYESPSSLTPTTSNTTITGHIAEFTSATRTTYFSSLPPYTALPVRLRQRYATAHKRFGDHTSRLNALEKYGADLAEEEDRRTRWETADMDKLEEKARRRASVGADWRKSQCDDSPRPVSRLRHCGYSASADNLEPTAREIIEDTEENLQGDTTLVDEFAADIQVRPISPCSLLVHGCSPASTSAPASYDGCSDSSSDYSDDEAVHANTYRYRRLEIATASEGYHLDSSSASSLAPPGLVYTRSAESLDSDDGTVCCGSPADDDDEEGEARRQRLRALSDDAISEGLFVFPTKHATVGHHLAPPAFSPSPLLGPIVIVPPSLAPSTVETSHHHHVEEEQDREDPISMRMDELWVDLFSGRRKSSGSAVATAAAGNAGGFFGWLQQQQQQHVLPPGAAFAC
ncbi:hypothetical protein QFC21_002559 [Naganishia friedmannii]|uniref:Uncharacterized protein n=1 Tax=Naganishia friedmannii TaxID=89922 RepID=A0ACC2VW70_9TREE|nr:hypothetical protein QFC21_002559 [Naganishia friedmannii]